METHAEPAPRSRRAARLKRGALLATAAVIIFAALSHAINGWRVYAVTQRLRHPDPAVRTAAVNELGEIGPSARSAVPTLLDLLRNDQSDEVVSAVVNSLWKVGPDTNAGNVWLRSQLKDRDAAVRTHAVFILGSHRPHWFLNLLKLRRPWVRGAVAALGEASADEDQLVRWMAVTSIMRYAGPDAAEAVPALIRALDDENLSTRRHAAIALSRIGPPASPAIPALVRVIRRSYPTIQEGGKSYEIPQVYALRLYAAIALGRIGPPAIPELVELLKDPKEGFCGLALMAFPYVGAEAVPRLAETLQDSNVGTRRCAAEAIGKFGARAAPAVPALTSALGDPDAQVRKKAVSSLGLAGRAASPAVPLMAGLLHDDEVNLSVLFAFAELGPEAEEAVPALLALVAEGKDSPDYRRQNVCDFAVIALLKIAPETQGSIPPHLIKRVRKIENEQEEFFKNSMERWEQDVNPVYR